VHGVYLRVLQTYAEVRRGEAVAGHRIRQVAPMCTVFICVCCRRTPKFEAAKRSLAATADVAAVVWT